MKLNGSVVRQTRDERLSCRSTRVWSSLIPLRFGSALPLMVFMLQQMARGNDCRNSADAACVQTSWPGEGLGMECRTLGSGAR